MAPQARMLFKVTVLGDGGVGKTALTVQFTMSSFVETYDPTIEDCYRKQWVVDDQPCLLEVLDTAGQEEYTSLRDQWIRDGEGFLIVYSIANRTTFERVEKIVERVHRVKDIDPPSSPFSPMGSAHSPTSPTSPSSPSSPYRSHQSHHSPHHAHSAAPRIPITLVGNKRDQVGLREVSTDEGRALAQRLGCDFYEASAKANTNVEASFKSVVRQIKAQRRGGADGGGGGAGGYGGGAGGHGGGKKRKKCVIL